MNGMQDFTIKDTTYRVTPMDPRTQLLVLKRLMRFVPALTASDDVLARLKAGDAVQAEDVLETVTALAPLMAAMPDDDLDFVTDACLNVTRHVADGKAYPVRDAQSGIISNRDHAAVMRKLMISANVLRIVFAPMLAEIAPAIVAMGEGVEAAA